MRAKTSPQPIREALWRLRQTAVGPMTPAFTSRPYCLRWVLAGDTNAMDIIQPCWSGLGCARFQATPVFSTDSEASPPLRVGLRIPSQTAANPASNLPAGDMWRARRFLEQVATSTVPAAPPIVTDARSTGVTWHPLRSANGLFGLTVHLRVDSLTRQGPCVYIVQSVVKMVGIPQAASGL